MTFGFPNLKKNSFRENYMRKYGKFIPDYRVLYFYEDIFYEKNYINHLKEFEIQGIGTSLQDESGEVVTET